MKERPILFNGEMVRSILEGRKTQTRRIIKSGAPTMQKQGHTCIRQNPLGDPWYGEYVWSMRGSSGVWNDYTHEQFLAKCPFGKPGDRLWVRERGLENKNTPLFVHDASPGKYWSPDDGGRYGASYNTEAITREHMLKTGKWKTRPSIHMPRWACRLMLEVTGVRVERIQDISETDARAEGVERHDDDGVTYYGPLNRGHACPIAAFKNLLESAYPGSWERNDWVWVIDFKKVEA